MKNTLILIGIVFGLFIGINAELISDNSKKPEPLPTKKFDFPKHKEAKLKNGLKLIIVEDHEQPVVTLNLLIKGGTSVDGEKVGVAEFTSQLLTKGAGKRNALEIATLLDGIGANLSANAAADYISVGSYCLKKHLPTVLEVLTDVLTNPTFPQEELEKLIPQFEAELKQEKANPSSLAAALSRMVIFGDKHPYAQRKTEKTIKNITTYDLVTYYKNYFKPGNATMTIVGDVNSDKIVKDLEKYIGKWEKGDAAPINIPKAKPMPKGVYFVERPASVQSSVVISTSALPANDPQYDVLDLSSSIIGAGFAGRLFRTLRETYSYTYTPFGYITSSKYANRFSCGADVRNSVTDSAIDVINQQLTLLATEPASDDELNRVKSYEVGKYLMNFESSGFIAGLIQSADFYGVPLQRVKDYPERTMNTSAYEIQQTAKKYMHPDNEYIVVVGSPDVREKLAKYGKIYNYNLDLEPATAVAYEKVSLNAQELIDKYINAIGGKTAINSVTTIIDTATANLEAQGQKFSGTIVSMQKSPNKQFSVSNFGVFKTESWINGSDAWQKSMGQMQKLDGKDKDATIREATMFYETKLIEMGCKCEVLGKLANHIVMKVKPNNGVDSYYYYDAKTFLIDKIEKTEETPQGPMAITQTYSNYAKFGDVMMPTSKTMTNPMFTIKADSKFVINTTMEDTMFTPTETK